MPATALSKETALGTSPAINTAHSDTTVGAQVQTQVDDSDEADAKSESEITARVGADAGEYSEEVERASADNEKGDVSSSADSMTWDSGTEAWLCVLGGFMISVTCYGVVNTYGVFEDYYSTNQLSDESLNNISWIGSLQLCLVLLVGCISGPLFDAGYFKHLIGTGGTLYVFSLMMTSISKEYYQFILSQGIGVGVAQGLIFTPGMSVLAHHFRRHRNIVFGIFAAGASIGGAILPIALQRLFSEVGFAWGVRVLAFIVLFCVGVGFVLCNTRLPPRKGGRVVDIRVFKSLSYTFLVLGAGFVGLGLYAPLGYGVTYATSQGMSQRLAFYSLSILNAGSAIGRTVPNIVAAKFGPLNVLIVSCIVSTAFLFVWITATSNAGILVYDAFFGIVSGTYVSCLPAATASMTKDPKETGLRLGMMFFTTSFFWLASSPIQGALIRIHGTYWPCAVFSGASVILGVVFMLLSRKLVVRDMKSPWV